MAMIQNLRRASSVDILDYGFLMSHLKTCKSPRDKVTRMLRAKELIRIKKGLYVFGPDYRRAPLNRGVLAHLIYGPSYVSGLYALSIHGLIPERVEVVTSMTTQRNKRFSTPLGVFEYRYLNNRRFTVGVDWRQSGEYEHFLLASPEKALADVVFLEKDLKTPEELLEHLVDNLRVEEEILLELDRERLKTITSAYKSPVCHLLSQAIEDIAE